MPARLFTDKEEQQIAQEYLTPNPDGTWIGATELGRRWGTNHRTIYKVLQRQQVETRNKSEAHSNGKRCKPVKNLPKGKAPQCKCGCNQLVEWNQRKNKWNNYVKGHYHPKREYHDRDWLYNKYVNQQLTASAIAELCNVSKKSILYRLHKLDIPTRSQSESLMLSGAVAGDNNPSWKGGVTPERQSLYNTPKWKTLVKKTLRRDNYHCVRCDAPKRGKGSLQTHHIKPWADYPEFRFDIENLITLCDSCHTWVHSNDNIHKEYLEA